LEQIFENSIRKSSKGPNSRVVAKFGENRLLGSWRNVISFGGQ